MGHAIHFDELDPDLDIATVEFSLRYQRPAPVARWRRLPRRG